MNVDINQEWIDSYNELEAVKEKLRSWQDRFMPLTEVQPGRPMRMGEALPVNWMEETGKLEQHLAAAEERYQRAWQAIRDSASNN